MIFKRKNKVPLKTSKHIMAPPIQVDDKLIIPIHHIDVQVFDIKFPNLFGSIESKGCIIVENNESHLLSLDATLELNELIENIPGLEETLNQQKQGGTHEH